MPACRILQVTTEHVAKRLDRFLDDRLPELSRSQIKRLIDEVGGNGGFILGVGCEVPATCKPENLRALLETGRHYELGG